MIQEGLLLHLLRHIHVAPTCFISDFSRDEIARAQDILEMIYTYKQENNDDTDRD